MIDGFFEHVVQMIGLAPAVIVFLAIGIAGLKYGADWLVNGASNAGFRFGISATMIGLTIVAFGTSAPELMVSVLTAVQERPEICLGNVVGSNIANVALILGVTALVSPLKIQPTSIRSDGPLSFAAILLVFVMVLTGLKISRVEGLVLLAVFTLWMVWLVRKQTSGSARKKQAEAEAGTVSEEVVFHRRPVWIDGLFICGGLLVLVAGADMLVVSAVATAHALHVPDVVVGLTVVAVGTSLPELAVCLVSALGKQGDITVGNVLGSNIFNALLILGAATVIFPIAFNVSGFALSGDAGTVFLDIPFCVFLCALIVPLMAHRQSLGRWKGLFLLVLYVVYMVFLVFRNL